MFLPILLCLTSIVLIIYLYNQNANLEYFEELSIQPSNTINNISEKTYSSLNIPSMPLGDIHFIIDNSSSLIEIPLLNYKLSISKSKPKYKSKSKSSNTNNTNNGTFETFETFETVEKAKTSDTYISVFYHKNLGNKYAALGQYIHISKQPIIVDDILKTNLIKTKKSLNILTSSLIMPIRYGLIWSSDINEDGHIFSVWHPYTQKGYTCMGDIIVLGTNAPPLDYVRCLPISILEYYNMSNGIIWHSTNDMNNNCYCWGATNIDLFRATNEYTNSMYELSTVYNLPQKYLQRNTLTNKADVSSSISNGVHI